MEKTKSRARDLADETRREIESHLDDVIYYQMRKLEKKSHFLRQYWSNFDLERRGLHLTREELLAERVALTVLRSGEVKGTSAEKVLTGNEFSIINSTLKAIDDQQRN